jgi:hypothetical protein
VQIRRPVLDPDLVAHYHVGRVTYRRLWAHSVGLAIAAAAIVLKWYQWYHARTLWLDEEMVFLNVRDRVFTELAGPLWLDQTAPLGWLAIQRLILQTFGTGDRAVRALSVLFGVATIVCAAWIVVRWLHAAAGALFILLCGLGQWMTYYALEAKPYAADGFFGLLLPALVVWAVDGKKPQPVGTIRTGLWWTAAAIGQWISYGAVFVAPGCAALLCAVAWWRGGWRRALIVALQGLGWVVCFAAHYYLVLRHAQASTFLADFWASGMPPAGAGFTGTLAWLWEQAGPLASHPGGTDLGLLFWIAAGLGIIAGYQRRPILALALLLVPLSACAISIAGLVPLKDRLALWMLPAVYLAIALAADAALRWSREWYAERKHEYLVLILLTASVAGTVSADLIATGRANLMLRPIDNHGFNDRAALRLLTTLREPGDVLLATHFGLPAVWWYGGISIADPNIGRRTADGAAIFEMTHLWPDQRPCRHIEGGTQLQRALAGAPRAAVHLGFDSAIPEGFQQLILDALSEFAELVFYKRVSPQGAIAIFDLRTAPDAASVRRAQTLWRTGSTKASLAGCVFVRPAHRW